MGQRIDETMRRALADARAPSIAAARQWRDGDTWRSLSHRFAQAGTLAAGEALAAALLVNLGWVEGLLAPLIAHLSGDPLFEAPIKAHRDRLRTGAVLFEDAAVIVTATVSDHAAPAAYRVPDSVVVPGRVTWTRYIRAGGATMRRWRAEPAGDAWTAADAAPAVPLDPVTLHDGAIVRHDGRCDAMLLSGARADVVALSLTLKRDAAPFMREYACDTGALLRIATLDDRAARCAMLLSVLREMEHRDPRPFEAATRDPAFFLRWDAMRDWLASDAAATLPRLREMAADDPHPKVRGAAATMLPRIEALVADATCHAVEGSVGCPA